jgi:class 3 adenylate cyclase
VGGERRIVTALFCDIANSTALASSIDPEDWADLIDTVLTLLSRQITDYGGTVARLMGDGLLALFGAPLAHEDDPERAVLAGLAMLSAIEGLRSDPRLRGIDLQIRVGINTGDAVVGSIGGPTGEYTALGDAINVAARMEQTAAPGTIQLAEDTWRFVSAKILAEPLGAIEVKGKSEPIQSYRATGIRPHQRIPFGESVLVGREEELAQLQRVFAAGLSGRGQVVAVLGDPGIGKSRLVAEARGKWEQAGGDPARWVTVRNASYETGRPFSVFRNLLIELENPVSYRTPCPA